MVVALSYSVKTFEKRSQSAMVVAATDTVMDYCSDRNNPDFPNLVFSKSSVALQLVLDGLKEETLKQNRNAKF